MAGKLRPRKYGDKLGVEHTGKDGGPMEHEHSVRQSSTELLEAIKRICDRRKQNK